MMLAISNHFVGRLLLHTILRWFCTAKDENRLSPAENPGKAYRGGDCRRHGEHQRFIERDGDVFLGILTWFRTNKVWHTPRPTDTEKKSASTTSITSLAWYTRLWNLIQCAWLKFEAMRLSPKFLWHQKDSASTTSMRGRFFFGVDGLIQVIDAASLFVLSSGSWL